MHLFYCSNVGFLLSALYVDNVDLIYFIVVLFCLNF